VTEHLEEIFRFLQRDNLDCDMAFRNQPFDIPFDLKPEDFMAFAKEDLKENMERSLVNALSNIKRALDCRIASLLCFFGVYNESRNENWSFPKSTDFLLKTGVIAPNILKKVNKKRNELEHEFKKPTREEVVDFLDVASLFLGFTSQFLHRQYLDFDIYPAEVNYPENYDPYPHLSIKLNSKEGIAKLIFFKDPECKEELEVSVKDEENYVKILRAVVKRIVNR